MKKPIALFDIDNTMYEGFSYFELLKKHVSEQLIAADVLDTALGSMQQYKSGARDYEATIITLLDIYAAGLKGADYDLVLRSTKEFYENSSKFFDYVAPTIARLRTSHDVALVTGEPQFVAEAVGALFEITSYYSTQYQVIDGHFTGITAHYLASRHEKLDAIKHLTQGHQQENSFAFGDSEGDIEMLRAVQYPICLNPTDGLRDVAEKENWYLPKTNEVEALIAKLSV